MTESITQQPRSRKRLIIVAAALAAVTWWIFHDGSNDGTQGAGRTVQVTVAPAVRQDVPIRVSLVGNVVAYETVAVKSRLDSQVVNVPFKDGDYVKEGQVLFELDDRTVRAQIKQFEAALDKEKAQLSNTKLQYERASKLIQTNAVAQAQLDQAKAANEAQQALVNAAQANLDSARVQLSYTTITAPISGRAGTINVTRGNNVTANDSGALVTINQVSPIRVQFSIPQRYYEPVRQAMAGGNLPVIAQQSESRITAQGQLEYVDNAIDVTTGTFAARALFANEDEKLWPGMFLSVTLELGKETGALTVPSVAIQGDEGSRFVFAVNTQNKAVRTPVEVSISGDLAIVMKGVSEGDRVIIDGLLRVTDGATVEITMNDETIKDEQIKEEK